MLNTRKENSTDMTNNVHSALAATKTESGLHTAFTDESISHMKYRIFADAARRSGNEALARAFEDIASHEAEHAVLLFEYLDGISDDPTNLESLIASEDYASTILYPELADLAESEGFTEISDKLRCIASAEARHSTVLNNLRTHLAAPAASRPLLCPICGYLHSAPDLPDRCPLCSRKTSNFVPVG